MSSCSWTKTRGYESNARSLDEWPITYILSYTLILSMLQGVFKELYMLNHYIR